MSIVKMTYQCQCGAILKAEDRSIMELTFVMQSMVIDHEDEDCR